MIRQTYRIALIVGVAMLASAAATLFATLLVSAEWVTEQRVVHAVSRLGGTLQFTEDMSWARLFVPRQFGYLHDRVAAIDISQLPNDQQVGLAEAESDRLEATREVLSHISQMRYLESLDLRGSAVSDDDLRLMSLAPKLRVVYLFGTRVTNAGIRRITKSQPRIRVVLDSDPSDVFTAPIYSAGDGAGK